MKKYFIYQLKKNLLTLACFTLFCIVMYVIPIAVHDYSRWNDDTCYYMDGSYLSNIAIALGIMCILIPILVFSYKMNKRSIDMNFSLPVSRTKIFVAHFLVGLIMMYVAYSVAYWLGFVIIAIKVKKLFLIWYLYIYLASLIPAFIFYSIAAFAFTRANTIIDGIITIVCILLLPALITCVLYNWASVNPGTFLPFAPLYDVFNKLGNGIINGNVEPLFASFQKPYDMHIRFECITEVCMFVGEILWLLLSIGATIGAIMTERNCKAENCGQRSESIFCYKSIIPIYTISFVALAGNSIVPILAVIFAEFVVSIIYKRTIKIGWKYFALLLVYVIGGILLGAI